VFIDPQIGKIPNTNKAHISFKWCTYQPLVDNWVDRWYMVFDVPPHNNREIPLYFLRRMYAKYFLGKHINYFHHLEFQGVGLEPNCLCGDVISTTHKVSNLGSILHTYPDKNKYRGLIHSFWEVLTLASSFYTRSLQNLSCHHYSWSHPSICREATSLSFIVQYKEITIPLVSFSRRDSHTHGIVLHTRRCTSRPPNQSGDFRPQSMYFLLSLSDPHD